MEVIIIVDWEEVPMDISIPQLHVRARYAMDGPEEDVEFQEASRALSLQTKAAIFCLKLVMVTQQSPVTVCGLTCLWGPNRSTTSTNTNVKQREINTPPFMCVSKPLCPW